MWNARLGSLELLADLRDQGAIDAETFEAKKAEILADGSSDQGSLNATEPSDGGSFGRDSSQILMTAFGGANRKLGRLLVKVATDQTHGRGFVQFFALADHRIEQAEKVRLWVGIVALLVLLGALFGSDSLLDALKSMLVAAVLAFVSFTAHKWREVWVELKLAASDHVNTSPTGKEAFERDKAAYREALELASMSRQISAEQGRAEPSKVAGAAAFAVGAVAGYQAVKSHGQKARNEARIRHLVQQASSLTNLLKTTTNPDWRRKWEAELRQIEIELSSLK